MVEVASETGVGARLAARRKARRMTQRELADAATVSVDVVRKLEQRQRTTARLETLTALAHALDTSVGDLIGKPAGLVVGAEDSEMLQIRRAVLGVAVPTDTNVKVAGLKERLRQVWALYWAGDYGPLARDLPGLIVIARLAVSEGGDRDRREASRMLGELLQVTASLLAHLAHEDLAYLALHGALDAAEHADDRFLHAALQATRSWILSRQGLWAEAEQVAASTAQQVEPVLSQAGPDQVAVWGELLRYTALALSRGDRHQEAGEVIRLMTSAAVRMGSDRATRYVSMPFGPTVVGMRMVDAAISAGDLRRAHQLARRVEHPEHVPAAMHSRYLLNVAWAQTQDWRSEEAVATLLRAEHIAPAALAHQSLARLVVTELLPRRRKQRLPGLVGVAGRLGVTV